MADGQLAGTPSQLFDAVAIILSDEDCKSLLKEGAAVEFAMNAFGHLKAIGASDAAKPLLDTAGVEKDEGITRLDETFVAAAEKRCYARKPGVTGLGEGTGFPLRFTSSRTCSGVHQAAASIDHCPSAECVARWTPEQVEVYPLYIRKSSCYMMAYEQEALTITQFFKLYPDEETCLAHLFETRFGQSHECPKCNSPTKWYRIKAERAYSCQWCGHHLHPTVGTPFEQTRTPLQYWFYAMYLFTTTRHGVPAKELQRQLGVTYKTAWRMGHEIRKHMADVDGDSLLGGVDEVVEIDETIMGGSVSGKGSGFMGNKAVVVGMLERGGDIVTRVVPSRSRKPMEAMIHAQIVPGTTISSDEHGSYRFQGFEHVTVNHKRGERVKGLASTNAIESYWSQLKRSINGTHISVSSKHLEKYAKEFEYRFNRRRHPETMFVELLSRFSSSSRAAVRT